MKKIELGQAIGIVANIGVIAGLVFVGMQLRQESEVAQAERFVSLTEGARHWAELMSSNADLWQKGLTGEQLTPSETIAFNALATAWEREFWRRWITNRALSNAVRVEVEDSRWAREVALDLQAYPGLRSYWSEYANRTRRTTNDTAWVDSVEAQLQLLHSEPN